MFCRLQSRIIGILILATTLSLCLSSHGSVFSRIQNTQLGKRLQKGSELDEDRFHLKITERQVDPTFNVEAPSLLSPQTGLLATKDSMIYKLPPAAHQSKMFTPGRTDLDVNEESFQSDSPGFDVQGNLHFSTSQITEEWFHMRPVVQCSQTAIILSTKGWNYIHLLVERAGASPLSVLHMPSYCGFDVKATWRDLVLMAPYDGCYVFQQNERYILPLLWCGMHVSISCPITPVSAHATPSGFCSHLGITLKIVGSRRGKGTYNIKVNEKWVPLVSNTCAYRMDSATEDLILFIPFTVQCAEDQGSTLDVLLDGKPYTLSCQPHHHLPHYPPYNPAPPFSQSLHPLHSQVTLMNPSFNKPERSKPPLAPEKEKSQHHTLLPSERTTARSTEIRGQNPPHSYDIFLVPVQHSSESPVRRTEINIPPFQTHFGHFQLNVPFLQPGYEHFLYPIHPYFQKFYNQKPISPDATQRPLHPQVTQRPLHPQVTQRPLHPQVTQRPLHPQVTQRPLHPQVTQRPLHPQVTQRPTNDSSLTSPLLTCKGGSFRAFLPSAKMNSIKVKGTNGFGATSYPILLNDKNALYSMFNMPDVKRKVWVPVSSAPVHCGYMVKHNGKGVEFFSPIPACHSYPMSPLLLSLSLKFSDIAKPRRHAVRLECPYTSSFPTTSSTTASFGLKSIFTSPQPTSQEIQPPCLQKPLHPCPTSSKPGNLSVNFQKPIVPPLYPDKPTAPTSQSHIFPTSSMASQMLQPQVFCHSNDMSVTLPHGPVTGLTVRSKYKGNAFNEAPSYCGYLMKNEDGNINILMPYKSCHMAYQDGQYRIVLKYQTVDGDKVEAYLSCHIPTDHECNLPVDQRLACGSISVREAECHDLGCCFCSNSQTCFYPMNECTADQHFVFSVPASLTEPPLSPALLAAAGNNSCTPQKVVEDLALFKIPLDGCGAHKYEVGSTVIYMLEILNTLKSVTLNYGTITRDSPFRLLVECRYLPSTVSNVGYLVKSPTLGPAIEAQGVFGVQLRIAKDRHYRSYYPQYHRPLQKLLGKPLYLEVRLLNPVDPSTVLLVHYCVAYPRSAHSAWVLIYDGCPNPYDVAPSHEPFPTPPKALASHVRRFTVSTFQFLDISRNKTALGMEEVEEKREEEEIYFMCATEVCLPSEGPCIEGCIDRAMLSQQ